MSSVESGRVEMTITAQSDYDRAQNYVVELEGGFQAPDRTQFEATVPNADYSGVVEIIGVGGLTYTLAPEVVPRWTVNLDPITPYKDFFAFGPFSTDFDAEVINGFEPATQETLGGERVYYLRGPVPGKVLGNQLVSPKAIYGEGEIEYWVAADDFRVRKMVMQLKMPGEEQGIGDVVMQIVMTLSDYGKPLDIRNPAIELHDSTSDDQTAVTTNVLDTGWIRADIPEKGFAISVPPSWEFDTRELSANPSGDIWLAAEDTTGPDAHGIRSSFSLQIDYFYPAYTDVLDYLDTLIDNMALAANIDREDITVVSDKLRLKHAGHAVQLSFFKTLPTLDAEIFHVVWVVEQERSAFIVHFTTPAEIAEEAAPVFVDIATNIETYEPDNRPEP